MPISAQEKRQFPRIDSVIPLRYQIRGTPEFDNTVCENISIGGLCFTNYKFIAPQTCLKLEFNILSRMLNPVGKVLWINPFPRANRYKVGIEFLEFDAKNRLYLGDFINMRMGKF